MDDASHRTQPAIAALCHPVSVDRRRLVDQSGRQVLLRGVNLGGDSKVPWPHGGTHHHSDFADHREVSFVGRPFPLDEAAEHFGRLRHWGFNCVRLLTTWEAVEHAGPGIYDEDYLGHFAEICRAAGRHGLHVLVDFHQDVWSRMSGGCGAPGWTFEAVGLDFTRFHAADAAHVMQSAYDYTAAEAHQPAYPQMSWAVNYRLPANSIMWTLFWAGAWSTPGFRVEGRNVQEYLQGHYLEAVGQVARRLRELPNVLGFDTLNEPGTGWVGERLSYRHLGPSDESPARARPGPALSALDALSVARGIPTTVPELVLDPGTGQLSVRGERLLNPDGISIWRPQAPCPFEAAGAYVLRGGTLEARNEDLFRGGAGARRTLSEDCYGPFYHRVAAAIREHNPRWLLFAEMDPWGVAGGRRFPAKLPPRTVNANHWYDAPLLYSKRFDLDDSRDWRTGARLSGPAPLRARYARELAVVAGLGDGIDGGAPSLVGEFGLPFDVNGASAYAQWSRGVRGAQVWQTHTNALALMYDALDELMLSATLWNYTASNRNDPRIGDGWNQEDLSIFSRDQQEDPLDPDSGGRAVGGFCRPYAQCVQGVLSRMRFRAEESEFLLEIEADPQIREPTRVYVPRWHYPDGFEVELEGGWVEAARDAQAQTLTLSSRVRGTARLRIVRRRPQG